MLARPPIDGLAGLAGRRVAVESGAVGAYMLARCLETAGLAADDVTPVALVNNDHLAAYQAGEVDAVVTYEPMRSMLLSAGAVPVFSSREMPGEIVDVLAIPTDRLGTHGAELTHLCDAWFQTLDRLREHPTETAALVGERTKQPAAEVLASFELVNIPDRAGNLRLLGGDPPALRATGERLQRVLAERGLLERSASLEGLFDARFVDRGQAR